MKYTVYAYLIVQRENLRNFLHRKAEMDEQLSQILEHTYNPDTALREQAEAALQQFLAQPGALIYLLQLSRRSEISRDLRSVLFRQRLHNLVYH